MGKDDINLKTVKCNTCDNKMEIDKNSKGGNCWQCCASGRAFILPEALGKAPTNDTLLYDDDFAEQVKIANNSREERVVYEKGKKKVIKGGSKTRFGQTIVIDKYLKEGTLNDDDLLKKVAEEIPEYKGDWKKLIKLRKYHMKRKKGK